MNSSPRLYSDYLLEVQAKLQWTDTDMADHLKLSHKEWRNISEGEKEPSLIALSSFAESIDVDIEKVFHQNLDLDLLIRRNTNGVDSLPEHYIPGAFSRVRTSKTLLDFIEFYFGWRMRQKVLSTLNMNEAAIADSERYINVNFFRDICDTMKSFDYNDEILRRMGEFSVYSNRSGVVGKMFEDCSTPRAVYEKAIPVLGTYFEKNHHYRILDISDHHCTMESRVHEQLAEELKTSKVGSVHMCTAREGVGSSFVLYAGAYRTTVTKLECIHTGSDRCVCRFEWAPLRRLTMPYES